MKAVLLLLSLLGTLTLAQSPTTTDCQCPQVKCPADDAAKLCQCLNNRETLCKKACPTYKPTYLPCPISPPTPSPTPSCTCETTFCLQIWPQSCYCENANKQKCYDKCGGVKPELQKCPPLETSTLATLVVKPSPTSTQPPKAMGTHDICGGGRPNNRQCKEGYACIKDPYKEGCGPECDGLGICVLDKMCGGFAGLPCDNPAMKCKDDPRDQCDPLNGGADCGGLCVWPPKQRG